MAQPQSESVAITLPGGRQSGATLYLPSGLPAPAVLVAHDRWGLTGALRERAAALAQDRYLVLAVDIFGGRSAATASEADRLAASLDRPSAIDALAGWTDWIRADARCTRQIGLLGMGLGGGIAVETAARTAVQAVAVYDTPLDRIAVPLTRLKEPLLGHFSERSREFPVAAVEDIGFRLQQASKASRLHLYDADPDFANPASPHFARAEALLAWNRTIAFFRAQLGAGA